MGDVPTARELDDNGESFLYILLILNVGKKSPERDPQNTAVI